MITIITVPERVQLPCRKRYVPAILFLNLLYLTLTGCATWQPPAEFDDSVLRARAEMQTVRGVTLKAAVLGSEDSQRIFGVSVNEKEVQPVWVEVENNTNQVLWLLRTGTDPDLFSPLEVAWSFHKTFAGEYNDSLDEHFSNLSFQNPVSPGTKQSGILYTNPHDITRLLSVDILGQGEVFPFTLFPPVPDDQTEESTALLENLEKLNNVVVDDIQEAGNFRARLEQLPCCATSADENEAGDPLNLILIGNFDDVATAFIRRGFRLDMRDFDKAQRLYGRVPDLVSRKKGQAGAPASWVRVWLAPFSYQGKAVYLGQSGRRQGWRLQEIEEKDMVLHANVDEARNLLIQDMVYSNGLKKLAFVSGVGATAKGESRSSLGGAHYQTDGLRAVLFLVTRPLSLSDVELLDWHPYLKRAEIDAVKELDNAGQ